MQFPSLPDETYHVIYADPPWQYKHGKARGSILKGGSRNSSAATDHYDTLPIEDLEKLDVPSICKKNCLLFMWTTNPKLDDAVRLGVHWGFSYSTIAFVWHKTKQPLLGYYTLSSTEPCLLFKKGTIPKPRGSRNERQYVRAPQGRHSEKPDEVRMRIERMFPTQRKIELFARRETTGWDVWGEEVQDGREKKAAKVQSAELR